MSRQQIRQLSDSDIRDIIRNSEGRIERIEDPTAEESAMMVKAEVGTRLYYNVSYCHVNGKEELKEIIQRLMKLYEKNSSFRSTYVTHSSGQQLKLVINRGKPLMKDISDEEKDTKERTLLYNFLSIQRKLYYPEKSFSLNMKIIKTDEESYDCFVSIWDGIEGQTGLLKEIFGRFYEVEHVGYSTETTSAERQESLSYWKEQMSPEPEAIPALGKKKIRQIETEIYAIDDETSSRLRAYIVENKLDLRTVFLAVWGIMISRRMKLDEVILGSHNREGNLSLVPIRVDSKLDMSDLLKDIHNQLKAARKYQAITKKDWESEIGVDLSTRIPLVQNYTESDYLKRVAISPNDTVYTFAPVNYDYMPFTLTFALYGVKMYIKYDYDEELFAEIDVEQIHSAFSKILNGILEALTKNIANAQIKLEEQKAILRNKEELKKAKVEGLAGTKILVGVPENVSASLVEKSIVKSALLEEVFIEYMQPSSYVYMVCSGKVEASVPGEDGFVKTLKLYHEGEIFGLECLCGKRSSAVYSVCSESARVMAIPVKDLLAEAGSNPKIYENILKMQTENLIKYQRLWLKAE